MYFQIWVTFTPDLEIRFGKSNMGIAFGHQMVRLGSHIIAFGNNKTKFGISKNQIWKYNNQMWKSLSTFGNK